MIPIKDRLYLRQLKLPEKTKSGLIISHAPQQEKPTIAFVIGVGPEVKVVRPGMVVALGTKWFTNFKLTSTEEGLFVNENDIAGILDADDIQKLMKDGYVYEEFMDWDANGDNEAITLNG